MKRWLSRLRGAEPPPVRCLYLNPKIASLDLEPAWDYAFLAVAQSPDPAYIGPPDGYPPPLLVRWSVLYPTRRIGSAVWIHPWQTKEIHDEGAECKLIPQPELWKPWIGIPFNRAAYEKAAKSVSRERATIDR